MTSLPENLASKLDALKSILAGYDKLAVAFSGGVDSTLLLKVSCDVLGNNVTAYFADSVVQTAEEKDAASLLADEINVPLVVLSFDLLAFPDFVKNPIDRCYYCKLKIFSKIKNLATEKGVMVIADGTNVDDLGQFRPGFKAVQELGVKTPLVEAGLDKNDIRAISKVLGLSSWDSHSSSCLATRIASGRTITQEQLSIIETAEQFLKNKNFFGCRVRLDGESCTLELSSGDIYQFFNQRLDTEFISLMNTLAVKKVFLDLKERK